MIERTGGFMPDDLKVGDRVSWNAEAGRVRGTIEKKVTRKTLFAGRQRPASMAEPQYIVKSAKTGRLAMHKGMALRKLASR